MEAWWISLRRLRLASSSGADFTSSSSWRIMLPIRITLAGCSSWPAIDPPSASSSPAPPLVPRPRSRARARHGARRAAALAAVQRGLRRRADRLAVRRDDDDLALAVVLL